jgi:hypothetical protein
MAIITSIAFNEPGRLSGIDAKQIVMQFASRITEQLRARHENQRRVGRICVLKEPLVPHMCS